MFLFSTHGRYVLEMVDREKETLIEDMLVVHDGVVVRLVGVEFCEDFLMEEILVFVQHVFISFKKVAQFLFVLKIYSAETFFPNLNENQYIVINKFV